VDFGECVREIEALAGTFVRVQLWGPGKDARTIGLFDGVLARMGDVELPADFPADAIGETAVLFVIGDGTLDLWPSRFVDCKHGDREGWLDIRTSDVGIEIGPKRPAWSD
jgi:hypothetical protein